MQGRANWASRKSIFSAREPLLRKDAVELVKYGESLGIYMSITTNAWSLDKAMIIPAQEGRYQLYKYQLG